MTERRAPYAAPVTKAGVTRVTGLQNGAALIPTKRRRSPIPHSDETVRRWVHEVIEELGYVPSKADIKALCRWAQKYKAWCSLGERLERMDYVKADGEPTLLLKEWRGLNTELSRLERDLGLTASSRSALGLNSARGRALDLAAAMSADGEDVEALEGRIERLSGGGDGGSVLPPPPSSEDDDGA